MNIMKRSADTTSAAPTPGKHPRQDPVSCQSCRKRKLKCDRNTPCSCCTARKLECIYTTNPVTVSATPAPANAESERVESNGFQSLSQTEPQNATSITRSDTVAQSDEESFRTSDWLETIVMGHWIPNAVPNGAESRADP